MGVDTSALKDDLAAGRVLVVAGAGVTLAATNNRPVASWKGLLADGLNQRQIASLLVISPKTVGTHIERILQKLGVHSRVQAVALAYRDELVGAA